MKISVNIPSHKRPKVETLDFFPKILRLNMYHYVCKQSENKGGCAVYRNYNTEAMNFELLKKKWDDKIIQEYKGSKKSFDYNPIVKVPIRGV